MGTTSLIGFSCEAATGSAGWEARRDFLTSAGTVGSELCDDDFRTGVSSLISLGALGSLPFGGLASSVAPAELKSIALLAGRCNSRESDRENE